ncbi:MAG: ATP-dependent helicase HrpB [Gemmatimonadetes bacterium]|nr:ATP-dependent helicase HrpB [Gemmatimonadota bacterium]
MDSLPVDQALPALRAALLEPGTAVLQAPPGAGKTTRVPLALLPEPWLAGRRILMLEPRRLAARAAARYLAAQLAQPLGHTIGYRMRGDTVVGPDTRIEVRTEGVLTRLLQRDPGLEGGGRVIFDEFHERSLHADLGLALACQARSLLRPDLRLLVMSATLAAEPVTRLLGSAPLIRTEGRTWPVELRYLDRPLPASPVTAAARFALRALERHPGDVLVFLPGSAEIRGAHEALRGAAGAADIYPLHGMLPAEQQDRALRPSPPGRRKVVLATSIAETSLTIEGVTVVVDAGLMRVPRFSPRTGMTRLDTLRVSRSAADQRAGRAGPHGPGTCYRLWTPAEHAALRAHAPPEILEADLAPLALELAVWGARDPAELAWLDPPPAGALAQATELLRDLGALDPAGRVTAHGRALAALPAHPRLAHLLLRAKALGCTGLAADLAALLEERDPFQQGGDLPDPDLRLRLDAIRSGQGTGDRATLQRIRREAERWRHRLGGDPGPPDHHAAGLLLALAYPDRIGQRRPGSPERVLLRNGRGALLAATGALSAAEYLVAAQLEDRGREARIFLAAPLERADLERHFAADIRIERRLEFDPQAGVVRARELRVLGALVLAESVPRDVAAEGFTAVLLEALRERGLALLDWSAEAARLRQRLAFLHRLAPADWPDVSDAALCARLEEWLLPFAPAARSVAELRRIDLAAALLTLLAWPERRRLDELAPTHWQVPSGSRIRIDYSDPDSPVLAVRLQELFGATDTPRIAAGRALLTLHLLSPALRPVQVTRDLASFWRDAYFEVRKDLKGRYPRHFWPEDPLGAPPTRRTRPQA